MARFDMPELRATSASRKDIYSPNGQGKLPFLEFCATYFADSEHAAFPKSAVPSQCGGGAKANRK